MDKAFQPVVMKGQRETGKEGDMRDQPTLLVTGGAGFIGTNFVHHVLEKKRDWRVVNLDLITYAGNPANFDNLEPDSAGRHLLVSGDIRDPKLLKRIFQDHNPMAVVHFAAESHVDRSILGPEAFVETNVTGTFRLLQAALDHWSKNNRPGTFRFLHVSTDEVYGSLDAASAPFTEQHPYDPSSPYSASKAAADHFARAYSRTYGLPVLVTNCSNNYGPFQFPEKLIPLALLKLLNREPVPVYGDGTNVRDWLYVTDHCEALLRVLEAGVPGETYNIGGNAERTNLEVVQTLIELVDRHFRESGREPPENLIQFVQDRPGHDQRYAIDSAKIEQDLGWRPAYSFEHGMECTVAWYLNHPEWVESIQTGAYREWLEQNYGTRGSVPSSREMQSGNRDKGDKP